MTNRNGATMSKFLDSFDHYAGDLKGLSVGLTSCCEDCRVAFGYDKAEDMAKDLANGTLPDEGGFSWQQCDTCGSTLGGDRFAGHCIAEHSMDVIHLDVCCDCLFYIANGDVPEEEKNA